MEELFKFLDSKFDGKVEFGEFLHKLEEAKKEKKRIDRLKFVQKRVEELKKENMLMEGQKTSKIGEEEGLKVRLMGLETKQGHLVKKNEKLCKVIAKKEQEILDLERTVD